MTIDLPRRAESDEERDFCENPKFSRILQLFYYEFLFLLPTVTWDHGFELV